MTNLIEKILNQPDAVKVAQALQAALAEEAKRRHDYREWLDKDKKAEFINGAVVLHSPAKKLHIIVSQHLTTLASVYVRRKKAGLVLSEKALIGLSRNDYEPDMVFFSKEKAAAFPDEHMIFPAPDLVVEILSKSTAKIDRGLKKADYAAHGIREYWIIDPQKRQIEQYLLAEQGDQTYMPPVVLSIAENIHARVMEGFSIPVLALFDEDANMEALQGIMAQ